LKTQNERNSLVLTITLKVPSPIAVAISWFFVGDRFQNFGRLTESRQNQCASQTTEKKKSISEVAVDGPIEFHTLVWFCD
jgi:hypothetical protein